jgi:Zn-dependent M16 (insulinase) family peptidase
VNQALEGVPQNHNIELLEKYQNVTKEDVLHALKTYFLPLFSPLSSVAVVVTAPAKAQETEDELAKIGFEVEQRSLNIDPDEEGEFSESGGESDSDAMSEDNDESR